MKPAQRILDDLGRPAVKADFVISNQDLIDDGAVRMDIPPLETCQWCGETEITLGLMTSPHDRLGTIIWKGETGPDGLWRPRRERCACDAARGYWLVYDAQTAQTKRDLDRERQEKAYQAFLERLVERSEIEKSFPNMSFENFNVGEIDKNNPTELQKAQSQCSWYVKNFTEHIANPDSRYYGLGIFLAGGVGTGKTHLAVATLKALTEQGITTLAIRSSELLGRIRATYSDFDHEAEATLMAMLTTVDVLLIDDLGKSKPTEWSLEKLFTIIDMRISTGKPIIVTVNYDDAGLIDRLTPRYGNKLGDSTTAEAIVSRLRQKCSRRDMGTRDYRLRGKH